MVGDVCVMLNFDAGQDVCKTEDVVTCKTEDVITKDWKKLETRMM